VGRRRERRTSLCGFHLRRLHEGAYSIRRERDGSLRFEARNGRPMRVTPGTANALGNGERRDVVHTLFVLCTNAEYRERQAHSP